MTKQQSFNLSPQKRELFSKLLQEKGLADKQGASAIPPRPAGQPPPLSFAQERLWYLEKLMPGNVAYNIPVAVRLEGSLDVSALHQSLNYVIRRHEILRTAFDLKAVQPNQTILDELSIPLPVKDWSRMKTADQDQRLQQALTAEAQRPFNLETAPLLRAMLLKVRPQSHIFLFTIHHIIADGWSLAILFREVSDYYAALVNGQIPNLPPVTVQYPDFAHWQRRRLSGDLLESQTAYWREQLGDDLPELELPLDNARPPAPSFKGRWLSRTLPAPQVEALKALAQAEGTTLFVVLLAAFKTLLHRYSGQEEILLGSPVTNRVHHDLENVIGHFINTIVLRTDLSGRITFRQLVQRQKEVVLDAYTNQDIPYEYLLEMLQPAHDPRKNPLFQAVFNLQDVPAQANWRTALDLPGLDSQHLFTHSQTAKLDLTLEVEEKDGKMAFSFEYNTDIFSAATIERLASRFQMLLQGLAGDPDRRLTEYPLMAAEELQELIQWNQTKTAFPSNQCVHNIFEAQVAANPDATALLQDNRRLTYSELNARANHLAHRLRQLGVGPDVPVGICARRSFAFVTGLLGILKAGGAYLPLDINYPQERLEYMLENAQTPVLLIESELSGKFFFDAGTTIFLDTIDDLEESKIAEAYNKNQPSLTTSKNLAYIMYTSGSTGRPKGVAIPHLAINRLVCNPNYMTFEPDDVVAHLSSIAFDAATFEIWAALLNGLPLAIVPRETALVPEDLDTFLLENDVSILFLTTSLFNQVAYNRPELFDRMRYAMFGGEAGDPQAARLVWENHAPLKQLINFYGPTESTTYASFYPIQATKYSLDTVLIGYPVTNTTLYVLDKHFNPVPPGIPGELFIGGKGLARGYHRLPGKTAAAFLPDPFSKEPGARMYKTGDLVQLHPDPNGLTHYALDFLGRMDNQIKLRGFRIELSEIETVMQQFPAVQESIVLAREDTLGDTRLVAYLVAKEDKTISQIGLRHHLQKHLPNYMVPSAIVTLEALPLTTNGKVDLRKLPPSTPERPMLETHFAAPQSDTEQTIAAIWQEVLQLQQVGRYDNFFDLGGNSLLLIKVHNQLQQTFERKIPIVHLFTYSTIAGLAKYIGQSHAELAAPYSPEVTAGLERGKRRRAQTRRRRE